MSGNLKLKSTADYSSSSSGTSSSMGGPMGGSAASGDRASGYGQTGYSSGYNTGTQDGLQPGGLRSSVAALITTWITLSIVVISVFLVGFYLGRQHGIKVALDGQVDGAARLPLVPQAVAIREAEQLALAAEEKQPVSSAPGIAAPGVMAQGNAANTPANAPSGSGASVNNSPNNAAGAAVQPAKGSSVLLAEQKIDFTQAASLQPNAASGADSKMAAGAASAKELQKDGAKASEKGKKEGPNTSANSAGLNNEAPSSYNTAGFGARPAISAAELAKGPGAQPLSAAEQNSGTIAKLSEPGGLPASGRGALLAPASGLQAAAEEPVTGASAARNPQLKTADQALKSPEQEKSAEPKMKSKLTPGWYIQIAAKTDPKEAAALSKRLAGSKVQSVIETGVVKGVTYYRVVAGPFKSRDGAAPTMKRVKGSGAVSTEPFLKQVK